MADIQNNASYNKLKNVLKEVFQLDQADLDFGIYRIMNQKRNEINDFLDNRLLPQVTQIIQSNGDGDNNKIKQELEKAIEQANSLGVEADSLQKVIELKNKLSSTTSLDSMEQDVYSHLANFFKRYYKDGDFISLRRYKKDVYAIPYEGEEVKLHWANHDQYYIKTSEYLKNYGFKLPNGKSVKFELKEASTEQNNNKEQSGKERRFELYYELPIEVSEDGKILIVNFTYEENDKKVTQEKLNELAFEVLIKSIPPEFLSVLEKNTADKNKNKTLIEKHILDFTARNSFDYFIHKDLGGFLTRELDFYIKNEVLYLDDINTENAEDFSIQLAKIKAIKQVAQKIITFLTQLENFQKRLWLKKKFVISTNYCITLDRIQEKYYTEILKNKSQIDEWKELFKIDKIKGDLITEPYSEPLTIEFLKSQPFLVLDTKFFSQEFKDNLIAEFDDLESQTNGIMINSENFQGLNILTETYRNKISTTYIDPPYNTDSSPIICKNDYQHSSWLSLMNDRLLLSKKLMTKTGFISLAIDYAELHNIGELLNSNFDYVGIVTVVHKPEGRNQEKFFATSTEYMLVYSNDKFNANFSNVLIDESKKAEYIFSDEKGKYKLNNYLRSGGGDDNLKINKPHFFYSIYVNPIDLNVHLDYQAGFIEVLPITNSGQERTWKTKKETFEKQLNLGEIIVTKTDDKYTINEKYRESKGQLIKTHWIDTRYNAISKGTNLVENILGEKKFTFPKSIYTVMDSINITSDKKSIILDYFAGSGTTGHATIKLNKEEGGNRKFILIEMGEYFNTVTKPRIQKVIYTDNWKNGVPMDNKGVSIMFKYQDLESYEDVLNNLSLKISDTQSSLLADSSFKDEYMLNYMLDVESKDSLLNLSTFTNPFDYKLKITRNNESQETLIDLVETFNYLIGLNVKTIQNIRGYKVITGTTNERDEDTLIIWRNTIEKSNQDLNEFFTKMEFSTRDSEFQRIYVNGDNHLENLKTGDDNWKVVLIEEEFLKRMFDVQDIK
jgi:adenine-specific DNA-methyltransferase